MRSACYCLHVCRLIEFYARFKGQRDVSFEHISDGDGEDEKKLWLCTISLSGGRIDDHQNLVDCCFQVSTFLSVPARAVLPRQIS